MLGLLALTISSYLLQVLAEFPTDPCWVEGEACLVETDNLLSSLPGVPDLVTCRQICQDNKDCIFFSYYGPESFPFQEYCLMFSSCSSLHPCEDCRTEEFSCFPAPCGVPLQGPITDNSVDIITAVPDELVCKLNCIENPSCKVYTYYNSKDVNYPSICFLLSEVQAPMQTCEHCSTGVPDCRNITGICTFSVGAENTLQSSYRFENTGNTTTTNILALGECELTVLAVGGGGTGYNGGGGSGYVASTSVEVLTSQLIVKVGGRLKSSSLETSEGEIIITAAFGESGGYTAFHNGGAGYSGGGGGGSSYSGDGGEDGGNGHGGRGSGGAGSGLDISSIHLQQFSLTPGVRGKEHAPYGDRYGGGGGGVLVDGTGPQETSGDGQGYGGGGGGYTNNMGSGLVLLEIKPKQ